MEVARWTPGFEGCYKADPQTVYEEITSIGEVAEPVTIVEKAKDEDTELHKLFEWDDTKAAYKYRLEQARDIVRHLVLVREENETEEPQEEKRFVRCFYNLGKNNQFERTVNIVRNEDKYQQLLEQARRELKAFKEKYAMLKELKPILDLIG